METEADKVPSLFIHQQLNAAISGCRRVPKSIDVRVVIFMINITLSDRNLDSSCLNRQENAGEGFSNVLNLFKKPTMRAKTLILYYEVTLSIISPVFYIEVLSFKFTKTNIFSSSWTLLPTTVWRWTLAISQRTMFIWTLQCQVRFDFFFMANHLNMQDFLRFQVMAWPWSSSCTEDAEFHILGQNHLKIIKMMTAIHCNEKKTKLATVFKVNAPLWCLTSLNLSCAWRPSHCYPCHRTLW